MLQVIRLETSKIVYDNCRPGAPVISVVDQKSSKNDALPEKNQTTKAQTTAIVDTSQTEYHKFNYIFHPKMLQRPEYVYHN